MDSIFLTRGENGFSLFKNSATIYFDELRVLPCCNSKTPFTIVGKGKATVSLTDEELVIVIMEYLKYTTSFPVEYSTDTKGWKLSIKATKVE